MLVGFLHAHDLCYIADQPRQLATVEHTAANGHCWSSYNSCQWHIRISTHRHFIIGPSTLGSTRSRTTKAKQRCVMGVGMYLYAQLVQSKNKQCKSAIIIQCYHPYLSDFCSRPRLSQPYNHIIYPGVAKIYLVFF